MQSYQVREQQVERPPSGGGLLGQLAIMAAYIKELELQSHLIHLNYTGSNFFSVHAFLKEQYEAHLEDFDTAAEFIRSNGAFLPAGNTDFRRALRGFTEASNGDPLDQLQVYLDNLQLLKSMAQQLEPVAQAAKALDVVDWCAALVGRCSKAAWMLQATLA
jgi:DNA-binding ferritin-like protein